jgi:hypothetical protein
MLPKKRRRNATRTFGGTAGFQMALRKTDEKNTFFGKKGFTMPCLRPSADVVFQPLLFFIFLN